MLLRGYRDGLSAVCIDDPDRGGILVAAESPTGYVDANDNKIFLELWDVTVGRTPMLVSEVSTGGDIVLNGVYEV